MSMIPFQPRIQNSELLKSLTEVQRNHKKGCLNTEVISKLIYQSVWVLEMAEEASTT